MFKPIQALVGTAGQPERERDDAAIRRVFMVLHGFYGNLFLSKFATGSVGDDGEDEGIANARWVWAHSLREYDGETIRLALRRCQAAHPEFPPSLPQFVSLCDAIKPRQRWQPPKFTQPQIELSEEAREAIRAENRRKATEAAHKPKEEPSGLDLLKRAIADAAAQAGEDEAATLLRLDRLFARRAP
jgi:hypothetical protein